MEVKDYSPKDDARPTSMYHQELGEYVWLSTNHR